MYSRTTLLALLALLTALAASCKNIDCGEGTTERDGLCVPANETIGTAQCGPFTELRGTQCVPIFPPTVCDPGSTAEDIDNMGVTTCIGTGAGGCSAKLACPAPTDGKQTICGQLYDFENNEPFAQPGATGTQCAAGATTGPCALTIKSYDAVVFAMTGGGELATGPVYIDDCGRYKIPEITQPGPPGFIALGIDDTAGPPGPSGVTNAVGVTATAAPNTATKDFEAFIVKGSTYQGWATSGAPSLAAGIYAPVYRGHRTGTDLASGVTVTFGPMTSPPTYPTTTATPRDFYFSSTATTRTTLDGAANATGANGTALWSGATLTEVYAGAGGLPAQCLWEAHAAAAIPGVIFIQIFRPMNFPGMTCPL
jgi:hypothetical protein